MTEREGRNWLKRLLVNKALVQPIESPITGIGIPDIYFRTFRSDGWIELKVINLASTVKVPFRPNQLQWLHQCANFGGKAFLFAFYVDVGEVELAIFRGTLIQKEYTLNSFYSSAYSIFDDYKRERAETLLQVLNA